MRMCRRGDTAYSLMVRHSGLHQLPQLQRRDRRIIYGVILHNLLDGGVVEKLLSIRWLAWWLAKYSRAANSIFQLSLLLTFSAIAS